MMKMGCFSILLLIILAILIFNFPLFLIGIGIISWGIYEYKQNKELKVKSKVIPAILTVGILLSFTGCVTTVSNDDSSKKIVDNQMIQVSSTENKESTSKLKKDEEKKKTEKAAAEKAAAEKAAAEKAAAEKAAAEKAAAEKAAAAPQSEYFQNCTDLRTTYPSGVAQDHPAYQSKMDRDKDGWACE